MVWSEVFIELFNQNQTQIQAVMVVIKKDERFLLGKRSEWKASAPGYWCPISGRIESGETEAEAVVREVWEEVGLKVRAVKKLTEMNARDASVRLHWWLGEILEGEAYLKNNEHSEIGWFTREELKSLTPSFHEDLAILQALK